MTKRIPIAQLRPGMHVVGLDKSWWQTPFLSHKWTVQGLEDIAKLKEIEVREVIIDPTQGCDVEDAIPFPPLAPSPSAPAAQFSQVVRPEAPQFTPPSPPPAASSHPSTAAADMRAARGARDEALAIVAGIFEGVKIGKPIDSPAVRHAVSALLDNILHRPEASLILTQMQRFEEDLLAHAVDVCVLSLLSGKQQELSLEQLETLGVGALLHDVGKTRLPRNLLRKSNSYSPQAQHLLREHPRLGASLLTQNKDTPKEVLRIVAEHHELADGSGFPEGRTGESLSRLSQIVGIVNIYAGFVTGQKGQAAHLPTQALRRLLKMGKDGVLESEQVAWIIRTLGIYPIGSVVELNTGECGIIVATNAAEGLKPTVQIVRDPEGRPLAKPRLVDLAAPADDESARTVLRPLDPQAAQVNLADYFKDAL